MQWLLYGNHPSPVAFTGMTIVLVAGLCGVVSGTISYLVIAEFLQIYGSAADTPKELGGGLMDSERSRLLPAEEQEDLTRLGVDDGSLRMSSDHSQSPWGSKVAVLLLIIRHIQLMSHTVSEMLRIRSSSSFLSSSRDG
jgi:hypothetical protein